MFCLADDLIEPLRPLVDRQVRALHRQGHESLTRAAKAELLGVLTTPLRCDGAPATLSAGVHQLVGSLTECFAGRRRRLTIPEFAEPGARA